MLLFGFPAYEEIELCIASFFTDANPRLEITDGQITIKPAKLT